MAECHPLSALGLLQPICPLHHWSMATVCRSCCDQLLPHHGGGVFITWPSMSPVFSVTLHDTELLTAHGEHIARQVFKQVLIYMP